jgi:uncharacterized protein
MIRSLAATVAVLARGWLSSRFTPPKPASSIPATVASTAPEPLGAPTRAIRIREDAIVEAAAPVARRASQWKLPDPPPGVMPSGVKLAMDDAMSGNFQWMLGSQFSEGLEFFGYPYLAELTQRAEYRRPAEIIAKAMTMKWIKLQATGEEDKSDKIKEIEDALKGLQAQERFQIMVLHDGLFGRGQLFIDMGTNDVPGELKTPLTITKEKIGDRGIVNLQPIEPMWSYPNQYNSNKPLEKDFFKPQTWFVMGDEVHHTRLLTMVSRPVPDMLKPTYAFGGLSLTQMMKPYVDNWLRTRQSVSDLVHNFSVMVLKTDLGDILNMGGGQQVFNRAQLFNQARDNRGVFLISKDSEEVENVAVPLGTLDALQAQAQEHMAAVPGIPLIIMFGITPTGLNATADPELKEFARNILSLQEDSVRPPLTRVIRMIQVAKYGGWDPEITFKFEPLMPEDMKELADTRKVEAETDELLINAGIITPQESRQRIADQEDSPYAGLDTSVVPEPPAQPGEEGGGAGLPGLNERGEPKEEQPPNPNPEVGGVKPNGAGPHPFGHDALGQDDRWITVHPHGKEVKPGQPVLLSEGGEVLGGMGGRFTGKHIKDVRGGKREPPAPTKGAHELASEAAEAATKHAEAAGTAQAHSDAGTAHFKAMQAHYEHAHGQPAGAAWEAYMHHHKESERHNAIAEGIAKHEAAKQDYEDKAKNANELSTKANQSGVYEDHLEAYKAHIRAQEAAEDLADAVDDPDQRKKYQDAAAMHGEQYRHHGKERSRLIQEQMDKAKKEAKTKKKEFGKTEAATRFVGSSVADITEHFKSNYGLGFANATDRPTRYVRSAKDVDVTAKGAASKSVRQTLGRVDEALKTLISSGFRIKEELAKHKVQFASATVGKSMGLAWQDPVTGIGNFAISPKLTDPALMERQRQFTAQRLKAGKPRFTWGADQSDEEQVRSTIVHELAHALGLQKSKESPHRLLDILKKLVPGEGTEGQIARGRWVKQNISEYAGTNIKETDAELAAMVTSPFYKRGTLPKELEDHVDWLFNHEGRA